MVKVVVSGKQGLVQRAGSGMVIETPLRANVGTDVHMGPSSGYGNHEITAEIDLDGVAFTATDNGLVKTIFSFPANIRVLAFNVICSETISSNNTANVDFAITNAAATAANQVISATGTVMAGADLKSSVNGTAGVDFQPAFAGGTDAYIADGGATGDKLVMINNGTSNTAETKTSGKFVVYMKYVGAGPASLLTTV